MLTAELIAHLVASTGIPVQFGLLGEGNIAVATALAERGVGFVSARREDAAVSMADGWARRSGSVGFCSVTRGPGFTNAITSLHEAVRNRTSLVLLTGLAPSSVLDHPQAAPIEEIVRLIGAGWRRMRGPNRVVEDVAHVFREAEVQQRPFVLGLPYEFVYAEIEEHHAVDLAVFAERRKAHRAATVPDKATLGQARRVISASKRPLIVAGRGAHRAGAGPELELLAAAIGAKLSTTLPAKGLFTGNERDLGIIGGYGTPRARKLIAQADLVLGFGCSLNDLSTMGGTLIQEAKLMHCDIVPSAIGRWVSAEVPLVGDARGTAIALTEISHTEARETAWDGAPSEAEASNRTEKDAGDDRLDVDSVTAALVRALPREGVLVVEPGHCTSDLVGMVSVSGPRNFIFTTYAGAIGLGLGTAIGAAIAEPTEWTFLVTGDGSLLMNAQELDSARRLGVRLMIVVLDDGAYGAEVHYAALRGIPDDLVSTDPPDFVSLARGMGLEAVSVESLKQLEGVVSEPSSHGGPVVVHVPIRSDEMTTMYGHYAAGVTRVSNWGNHG